MAGGIRPAAEIRTSTVIIIIAAGRPVPPPWRVLRVLMGDLGGERGGGPMGRRGRLDRSREDVCGAVRARFVTRSVGWSSDVLVLHTVYTTYIVCIQ